MSTYTKQLADLYFDREDGAYRGVVEYYEDGQGKPISVAVEFSGDTDATFAEIEEKAFEVARERMAEAIKA